MDFIIFLAMIFIPIGTIVKIVDINDKESRNEQLTDFETFFINLATGIMSILMFLFKSAICFIVPFIMIFVPSVIMIVNIAANISEDLVPFAFFASVIISLAMYLFIVLIIILGNRKAKKAKEKEKELNNENYNNENYNNE